MCMENLRTWRIQDLHFVSNYYYYFYVCLLAELIQNVRYVGYIIEIECKLKQIETTY